MPTQDKIRRKIIKARQLLPAMQQHRASVRICQIAQQLPAFRNSQHIGFYLPMNGEVNTLSLIHVADTLGKKYKSMMIAVITREVALGIA